MKAVLDDGKSIYLQISESIEDDILTGIISEDEMIPSTNQLAKHYSINPATAGKGVNILVDDGIIYKKRGIGMCVTQGAREKIMSKRKQAFFRDYIVGLIKEAKKLNINTDELIEMIEEGEKNEE